MSDNLASALALVQTKLPLIAKHQTATVKSDKGSYSYDYADLADVSEQILPLLGDAGLAWTCRPTLNADGKFVLGYSAHTSAANASTANTRCRTPAPRRPWAPPSPTHAGTALCAVTGVAPKGDDNDAADQPKTRTAQRQNRSAARTDDTAPVPQKTAQRAKVDGPPLPGDDEPPAGPKAVTGPQRGLFLALFDEYGINERDERLDITRRIIGRDITSANDLTAAEGSKLIESLQKAKEHPEGFTGFLTELMGATA
jgi:hypothetical protein